MEAKLDAKGSFVTRFSGMSNYLSTCIRKEHKTLCKAKGRSVADIMGLEVGGFAVEDACSWVKAKVPQWGSDAEGILELVRSLHCFPLAVAQAVEHARI